MSSGVQLIANTDIHAPVAQVRMWFLSLSKHPERYQFDSHAGFVFTQGQFGKVGSKFYTKEQFFGITLELRFIITSVEESAFSFDCRPPMRGAWCRFSLTEQTPDTTALSLVVGTRKPLHARMLQLDFLREAIQDQIDAEVHHIKASIENTLPRGEQ